MLYTQVYKLCQALNILLVLTTVWRDTEESTLQYLSAAQRLC